MPLPPRKPPHGARFTHVYVDRGEPAQDSKRMRRRLAALLFSDLYRTRLGGLSAAVAQELGIDVPWHGAGPDWALFLEGCDLRDVLDLVTIAFREVVRESQSRGRHDYQNLARRFPEDVRRIFAEENVHYTVDDRGGVHFQFDEEFARNRAAAVAALQNARYANALHSFESGMAALAKAPPDGKGAIRSVFAAAEGIFRLIIPKAPRLGAAELNRLGPLLPQLFSEDETARRSSLKILASLKEWVDAAHSTATRRGLKKFNPR